MRQSSEALDYIRSLFAPENAAQEAASTRLKERFPDLHPIQIGAEEGKLLQLLIRLACVRSIIEVGSLAGYSALWMADALPEDGILHAINVDPAHFELLETSVSSLRGTKGDEAIQTLGCHATASPPLAMTKAKIVPHLGDARDVLMQLAPQGPFDMIFIDADKIGYPHYLDWAEQYIRTGGLIVGDNTLLFGTVWQDWPVQDRRVSKQAWEAMRAFNTRLADPTRYHSTLIPTQEGLTIAIKLF